MPEQLEDKSIIDLRQEKVYGTTSNKNSSHMEELNSFGKDHIMSP